MRSALTEQLAGGKPQAQPAQETNAPLKLLSEPAFPCLRYAKGEVVEAAEQSGYEETDVSKVELPGTAPSSSLRAGMVDYELNPYKRRGGEEVVGSSFTGLSSLPKHDSMTANANLIGGSAIGSLPKGLTMEQKKSILQATPMSPSLSLLNSMGPGAAINLASAEGRALRRSVLRGAIVVFITAGYSGKRFIFERCKQLGVRSVILDGADSWSKGLVEDGLAEKFVPVDFSDTDTLFERTLEACKKIRTSMGDLDAVTTFCELAVPLVARLAERLGLPSNSVDAVDTARNKYAARAAMSDAKLPTPKNYLIERPDQLEAASEHVGYPAVIKPISGAASIGVVRVNDYEQLKKNYATVISNLTGARVVAGALVEGTGEPDAEPGNAGGWFELNVMMEEYLDGDEVDVDLVLSNGETVYGAVTDNWPTVEPYFNETGSNCPSVLSRSKQMELLDLGIKAVQCMGFQLGVFHVELKYTSRGPRLIEVNARMGGGPVRNTNLLVWGVDLVEQHVTASCGIPCRPAVAQKPLKELAELTINAKQTGILEDDQFMEEAAALEGMLYARPLIKPGAKCVCVDDGLPTWIGEMMVAMSPVEEAIEWIRKVEEDLTHKIHIKPKSKEAMGV